MNRAPREQVALRNQAGAFVGIGLVDRDVDRFLAQALDETTADRGVLDDKRRGGIAPLNFHHFLFERVKRKPATDHIKNVEDLPAPQQNDTSGIVAGFGLAQRDVPAHDNAVAGLSLNIVIGREPFKLDDRAAGRDRALLILSRKSDRAHVAFELDQRISWLMVGVEKLTLLPGIAAAFAEVEGLGSLRHGWKVQDVE